MASCSGVVKQVIGFPCVVLLSLLSEKPLWEILWGKQQWSCQACPCTSPGAADVLVSLCRLLGVILSVLIFPISPLLLLPPGQMEMHLFVLAQDNLFHVFPLRYVERVCVSFFCGCKHFKITVVENNYGCFLAWFLDFHHHNLNMAPEH